MFARRATGIAEQSEQKEEFEEDEEQEEPEEKTRDPFKDIESDEEVEDPEGKYNNFYYSAKSNHTYLAHLRLRQRPEVQRHQELIEFINHFPWNRKRYGKYVRMVFDFVDRYVKIKDELDQLPPYEPRMNLIPELGPLPIGQPTIESLITELNTPHTKDPASIQFLLDSYLFIMKRRHIWDAIFMFTLHGFTSMNAQISRRVFDQDPNVRIMYDAMLDPEIPLLPESMEVYRCTMPNENFDILPLKSFVSYRLTSVTRDPQITTCLLDNPGDVWLKMMIKPLFVPALFIGFHNTTQHIEEREILLCPGIRFTQIPVWDKPVPIEAQQSNWTQAQKQSLVEVRDRERWPGGRQIATIYRRYIVSLVKVREHKQQLRDTVPFLDQLVDFQDAVIDTRALASIRDRMSRVRKIKPTLQ